MKKIKSYTSIWAVEKVIYAINDFQLPFPVTFNQMAWFVLSLLFVIVFAHVPPLSMIEGAFLKYLGIPVVVTWFMSQKPLMVRNHWDFYDPFSVITYGLRSLLQERRSKNRRNDGMNPSL